MPKAKPEIQQSVTLGTGQVIDILEPDCLYIVTYQGQPFSLRIKSALTDQYQYKRTSYPTLGHAQRKARELNHYFNSEDFAIAELVPPGAIRK